MNAGTWRPGLRLASALALVAWLCAGMAAAQPAVPETPAQTRARLDAAERAARSRYDLRRLECHKRFAVTDCLEQARDERRTALAAVKAERVSLDTRTRQERARLRQARVEAKAAAAQSRTASTPAQTRPAPRAPAAAGPTSTLQHPAKSTAAHDDAAQAAAQAQAQARARTRAARTATAGARRASQAQTHREAVMQREAQRARSRPPAAALPASAAAR